MEISLLDKIIVRIRGWKNIRGLENLVYCKVHGYQITKETGYRGVLRCPGCWAEWIKRWKMENGHDE